MNTLQELRQNPNHPVWAFIEQFDGRSSTMNKDNKQVPTELEHLLSGYGEETCGANAEVSLENESPEERKARRLAREARMHKHEGREARAAKKAERERELAGKTERDINEHHPSGEISDSTSSGEDDANDPATADKNERRFRREERKVLRESRAAEKKERKADRIAERQARKKSRNVALATASDEQDLTGETTNLSSESTDVSEEDTEEKKERRERKERRIARQLRAEARDINRQERKHSRHEARDRKREAHAVNGSEERNHRHGPGGHHHSHHHHERSHDQIPHQGPSHHHGGERGPHFHGHGPGGFGGRGRGRFPGQFPRHSGFAHAGVPPPSHGAWGGRPPFDVPAFGGPSGGRLPFDLPAFANWVQDTFISPGARQTQPREAPSSAKGFNPAADVLSDSEAYIVHIALPGAKKKDVKVDWDAGASALVVSGEIHSPSTEHTIRISTELPVGAFERRIVLGSGADQLAKIDEDNIRARMEDGILIVEIPKVQHADEDFVNVKKVDIE